MEGQGRRGIYTLGKGDAALGWGGRASLAHAQLYALVTIEPTKAGATEPAVGRQKHEEASVRHTGREEGVLAKPAEPRRRELARNLTERTSEAAQSWDREILVRNSFNNINLLNLDFMGQHCVALRCAVLQTKRIRGRCETRQLRAVQRQTTLSRSQQHDLSHSFRGPPCTATRGEVQI